MTIRELPPVTDEALARAGRVWELAGYRERDAIVLLAYEYRCEFVAALPWREIGSQNQRCIARAMMALTNALQRG